MHLSPQPLQSLLCAQSLRQGEAVASRQCLSGWGEGDLCIRPPYCPSASLVSFGMASSVLYKTAGGCVLTRSNKQAGLAETWKLKMSPPLNASRLLRGHLWALFLFYFLILLPQWRCISIKMGQSESFVHPWIRMDLEVPWRPGFHHWTL